MRPPRFRTKDNEVVDDANGRISVVLPAGNAHLSRCHAEVASDPGVVTDLPWRVQPDDKTLSYVEIWLPEEDLTGPFENRVAVSVVAPDGDESALLEENAALTWIALTGHPDPLPSILEYESPQDWTLLVYYVLHLDFVRGKRRGCFYVVTQPTVRLQPDSRRLAPSGLWTIRLHNNTLPADEKVHAWIQRDDTPFGYPIRGRQSYFDHADYQRFSERTTPVSSVIEEDTHVEQSPDCPIKRAGMINGSLPARNRS